jgi:hypothetical protein
MFFLQEFEMSDLPHFTQAPVDLVTQYTQALDQAAVDLGRTNSREDRVDWIKVNELMVAWWHDRGYQFP